ncbi:LexA family transcriptional regulator [Mailhella sp.]|uniref:LexA family transcriptional regulator n=1 Tax=Mailhella sp. TaxID=1981029 RepID=UPI0040638908
MNTSTPDTLDRLLRGAGLRRDSQLAEVLGVSPQAVSQARRKGRIPDGWVLKVAAQFGLSTDWIFFGRTPDGSAPAPAPAVNSTGAENEERRLRGKALFGEIPTGRDESLDVAMVPLVGARLAAGRGSLETDGEIIHYFSFRSDWLLRKGNPDDMVLMKVCGDSMEPDFQHGDMVLVDRGKTQIYGHAIYAMGINEEIYIKQVETLPGGTLVLRSRNPEYEPIRVDLRGDLADSVRVIGRVIWCCREV